MALKVYPTPRVPARSLSSLDDTVEPLYKGHHCGIHEILASTVEVDLSRVDL